MTGDITLMRTIGLMLVTAAVLLVLARRVAVPNIVVYIVGGLLLGPLLGLVETDETTGADALYVLTHVGIALLLFLVGLELSFDKIKDIGKVAVFAGVGQIVFTAFFGFLFAIPLGFSVMEAAVIAIALTFSSTVVVVKLLRQKGELLSLYGRIAVGIFLVQDLAVILALTMLAGMDSVSPEEGVGGLPPGMLSQLGVGLLKATLYVVVLAAVALFSVRYVMKPFFDWAARSGDVMLIWGVAWCFAFVVAAELLGLSLELGAFLAGVSLAQHKAAGELTRRLGPLTNFFIALFFLALGADMDLSEAKAHWLAAIVLSLFVLIGNPLIFILIVGRFGYSEKTSFKTSVTVAQISEFSLIFGAMAMAKGIIDQSILSLITVIGLITIVGSAYMILFNETLYRWCKKAGLLKPFRISDQEDESPPEVASGHIIIVGMNALGRSLAKRLSEEGRDVLAIDTDPRKLRGLPCRTLHGDIEHEEVAEHAGCDRASMVVSALQIEETNRLLAWRCKLHKVPVMVHAFDGSVVADLKAIGVDELLDSKTLGSMTLVTRLAEEGVVDP